MTTNSNSSKSVPSNLAAIFINRFELIRWLKNNPSVTFNSFNYLKRI